MPAVSLAFAALLAVSHARALHRHDGAQQQHPNWVVITTINPPTQTVRTLAAAPGWRVVVVADNKTPKDWALENVDLLDVEMQRSLGYSIAALLPHNHYA